MTKDECFYLGYIVKQHGYSGGLLAKLDVDDSTRYKKLDALFLDINNELVPFFIQKIEIKPQGALISFEDIDSAERAEPLVGAQMYLPLTALPKLTGNKFYFHEVIGFTVIDKQYGEIGPVNQVLDFPQQAILQIKKDFKEVLIPVTDHIVLKVDRDNKVIEVDAPEGLIDLYLGEQKDEEDESFDPNS